MTAEEAWDYQEKHWNGRFLGDICIWLRMSLNGGSEPLPEDVRDGTIEMLKARLVGWKPTFAGDGRIDMLVKHLIEATVEEVQRLMAV